MNDDHSGPQRFRDPLIRLRRFGDEILVRCPACDGQASVLPDPNFVDDTRESRFHRRLSCLTCGHTDSWTAPRYVNARVVPEPEGPEEPYFGRPLWLRTDFRGHVLWAFNAQHLDVLEAYISASLRERGDHLGSMSMIERLPAWMKSAKNRDDVLRALRRLRSMLDPTRLE